MIREVLPDVMQWLIWNQLQIQGIQLIQLGEILTNLSEPQTLDC